MLQKVYKKMLGRVFFWLTTPIRPTINKVQPMTKQDRKSWELLHKRWSKQDASAGNNHGTQTAPDA